MELRKKKSHWVTMTTAWKWIQIKFECVWSKTIIENNKSDYFVKFFVSLHLNFFFFFLHKWEQFNFIIMDFDVIRILFMSNLFCVDSSFLYFFSFFYVFALVFNMNKLLSIVLPCFCLVCSFVGNKVCRCDDSDIYDVLHLTCFWRQQGALYAA